MALRNVTFGSRFAVNEPDKYDQFPLTTFIYMTDEDGRLLGGARSIIRLPGSGQSLQFEDKSPYQFSDIIDLDVSGLICAELSGLCVQPELRYTSDHIGTRLLNCQLGLAKLGQNQPDIIVGRAWPSSIGLLAKAAEDNGFKGIVRTDRISEKHGRKITTTIFTHKDISLSSPELLRTGRAVPIGDFYNQLQK